MSIATPESTRLRAALSDAFSALDCRKALAYADGDFERAARWLTDGTWSQGKSVSWNFEALNSSADSLAADLRMDRAECMSTLKACGGSAALARRKLLGEPLLLPEPAAPESKSAATEAEQLSDRGVRPRGP